MGSIKDYIKLVTNKNLLNPDRVRHDLATKQQQEPWILIGRTDAEAEAPILWPLNAKSQHIGKDSDAGKDWGQKEKGMTVDEMVGWHHRLNGLEFEQIWEIVKDREPGVLQSMGLQRVGHNLATEQEEEPALLHRELHSIFYNGVY